MFSKVERQLASSSTESIIYLNSSANLVFTFARLFFFGQGASSNFGHFTVGKPFTLLFLKKRKKERISSIEEHANVIDKGPSRSTTSMKSEKIVTLTDNFNSIILPVGISRMNCLDHFSIPDDLHKGRRLKRRAGERARLKEVDDIPLPRERLEWFCRRERTREVVRARY